MRSFVLVAGLVSSGAGLLVAVSLDIDVFWRCLAALVWLCLSARELRVIAAGQKSCRRIRIDCKGNVELLVGDADWVPARLLSGSVVLGRYAWLRIRATNGRRYAELVRGDSCEDEAWRRFQVIWRHLGGTP